MTRKVFVLGELQDNGVIQQVGHPAEGDAVVAFVIRRGPGPKQIEIETIGAPSTADKDAILGMLKAMRGQRN